MASPYVSKTRQIYRQTYDEAIAYNNRLLLRLRRDAEKRAVDGYVAGQLTNDDSRKAVTSSNQIASPDRDAITSGLAQEQQNSSQPVPDRDTNSHVAEQVNDDDHVEPKPLTDNRSKGKVVHTSSLPQRHEFQIQPQAQSDGSNTSPQDCDAPGVPDVETVYPSSLPQHGEAQFQPQDQAETIGISSTEDHDAPAVTENEAMSPPGLFQDDETQLQSLLQPIAEFNALPTSSEVVDHNGDDDSTLPTTHQGLGYRPACNIAGTRITTDLLARRIGIVRLSKKQMAARVRKQGQRSRKAR
jgi:hypothetical protein